MNEEVFKKLHDKCITCEHLLDVINNAPCLLIICEYYFEINELDLLTDNQIYPTEIYKSERRKHNKEKLNKSKINKFSKVNKNNKKNKNNKYIYLLKSNNKYKIGISDDVEKRCSILSTGNPYKIVIIYKKMINNARTQEKKLHTIFRKKRVQGEWFKLNDNDVSHIIDFFKSFN